MLTITRERFESQSEYEAVKDMYIINNDVLTRAKESAIVMHPLPRLNEIDPEVDFDSRRAAYFRQMRYGLFVSVLMWLSRLGLTRLDPHGSPHHGTGRLDECPARVVSSFLHLFLHHHDLSLPEPSTACFPFHLSSLIIENVYTCSPSQCIRIRTSLGVV
jgi:hypothetical protein